jgi:hypothetical protein
LLTTVEFLISGRILTESPTEAQRQLLPAVRHASTVFNLSPIPPVSKKQIELQSLLC